MDEYLDEEIESLRNALELICRGWDKKVSLFVFIPPDCSRSMFSQISEHASSATDHARFLSSHNPAQVKRNVLASFTDVLLLPVTIVPKTVGMTVGAVGAAAGAAGSAAVQGLQMLNPQRWAGNNNTIANGYSQRFDAGDMLFEIGGDDDEDGEPASGPLHQSLSKTQETSEQRTHCGTYLLSSPHIHLAVVPDTLPQSPSTAVAPSWETLDLFLSLDVALELIHADRESLKRVDAFSTYPGHYGHKVQDTIEEVFILMLQALAERHLKPGFERYAWGSPRRRLICLTCHQSCRETPYVQT